MIGRKRRVSGSVAGTESGGLLPMKAQKSWRGGKALGVMMAVVMGGALWSAPLRAQSSGQLTFASPDEGLKALVAAAKDEDQGALGKVFGSEYSQLLSGDAVEDKKDMDDFSAAVQEGAELQQVDDNRYTVLVGKDGWPTPIPLVQKDAKWYFDTSVGIDEVLDRRIGENELSAIETSRAYAVAQWEYFTQWDWDQDGVAEYAQRLISSPGNHDGLFWETGEDETPSPLGALVAQARAEGYGPKEKTPGSAGNGGAVSEDDAVRPRAPFHGYYFKILTKQGPHAPGGKYNYIINGNMIAGYAMVAYPAKWGNSGVMTFIINQQGRVYQKNLGANTEKLAAGMTEYNPDPSWSLVE